MLMLGPELADLFCQGSARNGTQMQMSGQLWFINRTRTRNSRESDSESVQTEGHCRQHNMGKRDDH